jgi:radical SAM-linked protein
VRVRIRFSKQGKVRFTSHRDAARIWERACRRAGLPVSYSVGFSPRPRLHFGLALSTGHESVAEYLDVDLDGDHGPDEIAALPVRLSQCLPDGFEAQAAVVLAPGSASLQEAVTVCRWRIDLAEVDPATLAAAVERALQAPAIVVTRSRKGEQSDDDIRPAILSLEVEGAVTLPDGRCGARLWAELAAVGRSLRAAELVEALCPGVDDIRVLRTHQWIEDADGARREPIPLDATSARVAPSGAPGGPS